VSLCPHYRRDRDPREKLFEFGRCVVHFAVDDAEVRMCAELRGKGSWFLPFNKGWNDGAGNPPNPAGLKTDYLWKEVLTPSGLTNILENYAQVIETKNPKTGRKRRAQVFPRYHQTSPRTAPTRAISSSTRPAAGNPIPSPGSRINSSRSSGTRRRFLIRSSW
jgi:type I site-specific restriction-modification system R (restriction) subunit